MQPKYYSYTPYCYPLPWGKKKDYKTNFNAFILPCPKYVTGIPRLVSVVMMMSMMIMVIMVMMVMCVDVEVSVTRSVTTVVPMVMMRMVVNSSFISIMIVMDMSVTTMSCRCKSYHGSKNECDHLQRQRKIFV